MARAFFDFVRPLVSGPIPARLLTMLHPNHIQCGVAGTLCWAMAVLAYPVPPPATQAKDQATALLPDPGGVVRGYDTARQWLDRFDAPPLDDAQATVPISDSSGVCIILRRMGRVMGVGIDTAGDPLMLRRAVGKAMNEALGDPALASLSAQLQKNSIDNPTATLTVDALRGELGRTLTLELEVAGKLTPLIGRSIEPLARKIEPGLDGLAMRQGQSWEFLFPSHQRATNTGGDPQRMLLNLALKAGVSVKDFAGLAQRDDIGLYTFRTINLAQTAANRSPFQTFRGDTLVPESAADLDSVAALADGIVNHLLASLWPDPPAVAADQDQPPQAPQAPDLRQPLGLLGDYRVVADQYRPLVAPPLDQALVAFALSHYAGTRGSHTHDKPAPDQVQITAASNAAARILRELSVVVAGEDDPRDDPVACAAIVYAVAEQPGLRSDKAIERLFLDAINQVLESFDQAAGFINQGENGRTQNISPHGQSLLAGAMSRLLLMKSAPPMALDQAMVRKALDAAWRSAPQSHHIALLPWIGWGESDYAQAAGGLLAHIDELRLMREFLEDSRIGPRPLPDAPPQRGLAGAPDLHGGFALIPESSGPEASPRATAQSARPAAWVASTLREPALVPPQQAPTALQRHMRTVRFLIQLSVRETALGSIRNPQRALGGIRAAAWDSDQPVPAQALGLITAGETLKSLDQLQ